MRTKSKFGVIASVIETSPSRLLTALLKAGMATSREIRLEGLRRKIHSLESIISSFLDEPLILTLRSKEDGGGEYISHEDQWQFWASLPRDLQKLIKNQRSKVFVDWSLDLIAYSLDHHKPQLFPWGKVGASVHVFEGTPEDLPDLLVDLEAMPAQAFLKLVTMAKSAGDVERIRTLFVDRKDPRPLIAFAMGEIGEESRRLCLSWGSVERMGMCRGVRVLLLVNCLSRSF